MSAQLYGGIALDLMDGPVRTKYFRTEFDGKQSAQLVLGEGTQSIAVSVTRCPVETIAELETAVAELKAWVQRQEQLKSLPEVA